MAKVSLIAAMDKNRVIGYNNQLPWHLPADLKHFKALTVGKPIIMGRKTYESIGRPLPERTNIVVTQDSNFKAPGCQIYQALNDALASVANTPEVMVIGGASIFEQCLPLAQTLYLTIIHHEFVGDTFFPKWEAGDWREVTHQDHAPDEKNAYAYSFVEFERNPVIY